MSESIVRELLHQVLATNPTERDRYLTDPMFQAAVEVAVQTLQAVELTLADFHLEEFRRPILVRTLGRIIESSSAAARTAAVLAPHLDFTQEVRDV